VLKKIEQGVVRLADRVILNTEPLQTDFRCHYSSVDPSKFITITNGIDTEDFAHLDYSRSDQDTCFIVTHGGSLYKKRDPRPFLQAVSDLISTNSIGKHDLLVQFFGGVEGKFDISRTIRELGLEEVVKIKPSIAHDRYLKELALSNLLLLIQPDTDLQIPSKVFEYMATGKPILALAHSGATRDIVDQYQRGKVVNPYDPTEIKNALVQLIQSAGSADRPNASALSATRFSFSQLSKDLDRTLMECLAG
jgi:glycosyltransferase involved in cell wall biosynthesis